MRRRKLWDEVWIIKDRQAEQATIISIREDIKVEYNSHRAYPHHEETEIYYGIGEYQNMDDIEYYPENEVCTTKKQLLKSL